MPDPRHVHCGADAAAGPADLCLRLGSRADGDLANVYLDIDRLRRAVWRAIPAVLHDLIEVASYVYAADQAVGRGGLGVPAAGELGLGWRRAFHLHVPVRCPEVWRQPDVAHALAARLGFLSDDYEFHFRPMNRRAPLQAGLTFAETPYDGMVDEVMLFSGGLDSLGGAVQEVLRDGRKVLLVHHRSTDKLAARHDELLTGLERLGGANRPIHIPVWMNKAKALGHEFTQRTRSVVYLALAATLAKMVGRDRVRFYENGVVSLNLPVSAQVVGARATRTTHPAVLTGYARLVSLPTALRCEARRIAYEGVPATRHAENVFIFRGASPAHKELQFHGGRQQRSVCARGI